MRSRNVALSQYCVASWKALVAALRAGFAGLAQPATHLKVRYG